MVRGNWQHRVEKAENRKFEAKQRKNALDSTRKNKVWVKEFLDVLDRHCDRLHHHQPIRELAIWTDTLPAASGSSEADVMIEDSAGGCDHVARKMRSTSLGGGGEMERGRKAKGRVRSNSTIDSPAPAKKVHPRSCKESVLETAENTPQLWMCRSFFFGGCCDQLAFRGGKKNGGCRYVHGNKSRDDSTLFRVLTKNSKRPIDVTNELRRAEKAEMQAAAATVSGALSVSDNVNAMEMVFFMDFYLDLKGDERKPVSDQITEMLCTKHLYLASIVYIALDGVLLFDRFREGLIYPSDRDFLVAVLGKDVGSRRDSVGDEGGTGSTEEASAVIRNISGTVLEHILTFSPDSTISSASRVCKAWHREIGRNSPNLWKLMLDRRGWPRPMNDRSIDRREQYRDEFRRHYTVVRDMKAIQKGLEAILDPRTTTFLQKEMTYQDFSTRKHAPSYPNCCVGVQEWSPNRLLVAYQHDCSLRLFETVLKTGSCGGEKVCRELICQRVDPYRHTKKRNCRIVSLGLDEECVASLCHVTANSSIDVEAYVLVVMSRDEFLLGESSDVVDTAGCFTEDVSNLQVIDVGEAVLNYLLCSDVGDHRLLLLIDFLTQGGDIGEVEVLVSHTMAACGYGRFLVEVSISIPTEDEHGSTGLHLIDRKLFLFSATIGAIVWSGESNPLSQELRPRRDEITLSFLRLPRIEGGSRAACFFAVGSATSPAIMVGEIEPSGEVQSVYLMESSLVARNEVVKDGWEIFDNVHRPILITSTDVVAADIFVRQAGDGIQSRKSVISFHARDPSCANELSYDTLVIPGNLVVVRMTYIRGHHIALICQEFSTLPLPTLIRENEDRPLDAIDGHWFGENDEAPNPLPDGVENAPNPLPVVEGNATEAAMKVTAVIVHVPSRREVERICLLKGQTSATFINPHIVVHGNETIGLSLSWEGVVMTGDDVRSILDASKVVILDDAQTRSLKKKKKRAPAKGGKKDGFARGMSLRG